MKKTAFKKHRIESELTQEKFGKALGISGRHVRRIEAGNSKVTPTIEKLLNFLKVKNNGI